MKKSATIIVPCFNEQEAVAPFMQEMAKAWQDPRMENVDCKILFVNDGSSDGTLDVLRRTALAHPQVKFISFSRNFGKEAAIFAGLEHADSDFVAIMDVDLQDPPSLLGEMFQILLEHPFDCVATKRKTRKGEPFLRSWFARLFYKLINRLSKTQIVDGARDFRLMTKPMARAIVSMREYNRFSKGIFSWVGFRVHWLSYDNIERSAGISKWSFWSLFLYSLDGILAFSVVPLALVSMLGIFLSFFSFLGMLAIIARTLIWGDPVSGWPSMATIMCFMGGLQLFGMGIIGQYLSKAYLELKQRPIYIIQESN